jgi:hypothetical protein
MQSKSHRTFRLCILVIGIAFSISAVAVYTHARALRRSRNWQPIMLPVSLASGIIRTPTLGPDLDGDYEIDIQFEQTSNIVKLSCLVGNDRFDPNGCKGKSDLIDIAWKLYSGGQVIQAGNAGDDPSIEFSNPLVERTIGHFRAQKGQHYILVLDVKRDASELNVASPKVMIRVPRGTAGDYGAGVALEVFTASILAVVGLMFLGGAFGLTTRISRRVRSAPR